MILKKSIRSKLHRYNYNLAARPSHFIKDLLYYYSTSSRRRFFWCVNFSSPSLSLSHLHTRVFAWLGGQVSIARGGTSSASAQPPTVGGMKKMEAQSKYVYLRCIHAFGKFWHRFVSVLTNKLSASELSRKFVKSALLVGCVHCYRYMHGYFPPFCLPPTTPARENKPFSTFFFLDSFYAGSNT